MSREPASLTTLPLDILVDSLLPLLPLVALNALSACSVDLHHLIDGAPGEVVWRRKAEEDFHFPTTNTGRRQGWRELYRRLLKQSCYVWGQNSNGRLGISPDDSDTRRHLLQGGLPLPTRLPLSATVVGLEAGGFSFHALTSNGKIIAWGTMDGENWARGGALSHVGVCAYEPFELPATRDGRMGEVTQLEAGRKHVVARNTRGEVWEYRCFGRAYQVIDSNESWGPKSDPVVAVEAGWQHSGILTASGAVHIWWEPGSAPLARLAKEAGEGDLTDVSTQGVTFNLSTEPAEPADKIASIASGVNFMIALTTSSKLYYLDISPVDIPNQPLTHHAGEDAEDSPDRGRASRARLEAAFVSGERSWALMDRFCDMYNVRTLPVWEADGQSKPALETRITAISAHFHSFVAYSVPASLESEDSLVLMGDDTWTAESVPVAIPHLQGKGVIKVVQGDYHYVALTATGHLYSWGAYSAGALGLGHPQLRDTPLSLLHPSQPTSSATPNPTVPYPLPSFTPTPQPDPLFPGFTRGPIRASVITAPERVDVPTLIRFSGEAADADAHSNNGYRTSGKFVFAVTASGWHSGALAVELGGDAEEHEPEEDEATKAEFEREMHAGRSAGRGVFPVARGGRLPFRLGFPARGMMRGVGQMGGRGRNATTPVQPRPES